MENNTKINPDLVNRFIEYANTYSETWRDKGSMYWLARLIEEIGELSSSLLGRHEHCPELELKQIASICLNWLDMRIKKADEAAESEDFPY